jgi:hypothetical protein
MAADIWKRLAETLKEAWVNRTPVTYRGALSYEDYRATQNAGNLRKLAHVWAKEANIAHLARYATGRLGPNLRVLCHGTRNGAEIKWFRKHLPGAIKVLGTEIADTAGQFPDTIQWDFHDIKPEWVGAWDVIYSNSWDHAFIPRQAFRNWMESLSPRGLLFLEHTRYHTPAHVDDLDTFGATLPALRGLLDEIGAPRWRVTDILSDMPIRKPRLRVVVVGARSADASAHVPSPSLPAASAAPASGLPHDNPNVPISG